MKDTITRELNLESIHPELGDMECIVELDVYKGSTEGMTSDDPSEIEILSVKLENPNDCPAIGSNEITLDPIIEEQILESYES